MANAPTIEKFGIQSGTDRTLYIQWAWKKKNTKEYRVFWEYATGDGIWFSGSDTKVKSRVSTYTAPDNAKKFELKSSQFLIHIKWWSIIKPPLKTIGQLNGLLIKHTIFQQVDQPNCRLLR